jgi:hypothetical protein
MNNQTNTASLKIDELGRVMGGTETKTKIKKIKNYNPKDVIYKDSINCTIKIDFGFN